MELAVNIIYGLTVGHIGAAYALDGDYPKWLKAIVLILFASGYIYNALESVK